MAITEKAILMKFSASCWSGVKEDKEVTAEVTKQKTAQTTTKCGRWMKYLVNPIHLKAVNKAFNTARTYHYGQTLNWDDNGWRLLPGANHEVYMSGMSVMEENIRTAVENFITNFEDYKEEWKVASGGFWKESDYPSTDELREKFATKIIPQPLPDTKSFKAVFLSDEAIARIIKETEERLADGNKAAMAENWERLHGVVSHMAETLSSADAKFKNSLVGNIEALCELLPRLNIDDDPRLNDLTRLAREKLTRFAPEELRDDPEVRASVGKEATEIAKTIRRIGDFRL